MISSSLGFRNGDCVRVNICAEIKEIKNLDARKNRYRWEIIKLTFNILYSVPNFERNHENFEMKREKQ